MLKTMLENWDRITGITDKTMVTKMIDAKWNMEQGICEDYSKERLLELYDRPMSLIEVLERQDGPWGIVPTRDRIWVFSRPGATLERIQRVFACLCAERVLKPEDHSASWNAVKEARRFSNGELTPGELETARRSARCVVYSSVQGSVGRAVAQTAAAACAADCAYSAWSAARAEVEVVARIEAVMFKIAEPDAEFVFGTRESWDTAHAVQLNTAIRLLKEEENRL